jgi:hypothetical protein
MGAAITIAVRTTREIITIDYYLSRRLSVHPNGGGGRVFELPERGDACQLFQISAADRRGLGCRLRRREAQMG